MSQFCKFVFLSFKDELDNYLSDKKFEGILFFVIMFSLIFSKIVFTLLDKNVKERRINIIKQMFKLIPYSKIK